MGHGGKPVVAFAAAFSERIAALGEEIRMIGIRGAEVSNEKWPVSFL